MDKQRSVRLSFQLSIVTTFVVFVIVVAGLVIVHVSDGYVWRDMPYLVYVSFTGLCAAILCGILGYGMGRGFIFPVTSTSDDGRMQSDDTLPTD